MSVLTYAVIAEPKDAKEVGENFLSKSFIWEDLPGVDVSVLDTLQSLLSGGPVSSGMDWNVLPPVYMKDPDGGPLVYQIPAEWVKLMAAIDVRAVPELTERMIKNNWLLKDGLPDVPSYEHHLLRLRDISKLVIKSKSSLLYFVCP